MTTRIIEIQNFTISLKQLAAMRVLYAAAKQFFTLQLILSVPVVVFVAILAVAFDKEWFHLPRRDFAWFVGASGVFFVLLDICLWNPLINSCREKAAKIQQCFDSKVLDLPWDEIQYGKPPDHEDIEIFSKRYKHNVSDDLQNWYRVEVDALPHRIGRILCQRANCWWDMDLRRRYNLAIVVVGGILLISITGLAITLDCTSQTFFGLVVAPMLPFMSVGAKLFQDNRDAIQRLQAIKEAIDQMWRHIITNSVSEPELEAFSREIQIGIFNNRKSNPLIFDWVHQRAKPAHEETTGKSTEQYVAEYKQAHAG